MKKKILWPLVIISICLLISGCQTANIEETPLTSSLPAATDEESDIPGPDDASGSRDREVFAKLFHLVDTSSTRSEPFKLEYAALVKSVSVNGSTMTIGFDKIEPAGNDDPQGEFYTNKDELIESVEVNDNIIVLADPHNNFKAVTADGLKALLADGEIPFYFYSMSGEVSALIEMMLP